MSSSMWAWRVIVPGLGLAACLAVFIYSTRAESPVDRPPGIAPEPLKARVVAEGRLAARPGAEVTVGTESGGMVVGVPAREKAAVRKGDLLVEFRSDDQAAALAEADARLAEADADLEFQKREYKRRVAAKTQVPQYQVDLDSTRRDLEVATARRRLATSARDRGRIALGRARVVSPIDGVVVARYVEPGETAAASARLVTVCDLARVRVEAEVDEFDAPRIAPGDEVTVTAEGLADSWKGTVEEVPDRVADRSTRPEDPGRPSDTRVLLVKIALAGPTPLKLGQQVEVEIRPRR